MEGYLHLVSKNIVHRDLKPDNIMFYDRGEVNNKIAIIDFGYCQMKDVSNQPQLYYNVGSPKYMAPEAYKECIYSEKSDVWAIGVIFYQMLTGHTCDEGYTMDAYLELIQSRGVSLPQSASSFAQYLSSGMLSYSAGKRFSCLQAYQEIRIYQKTRIERTNQEFSKEEPLGHKNNIVFKSVAVGSASMSNGMTAAVNLHVSVLQPNVIVPEQAKPLKILTKSKSANLTPLSLYLNQGERPGALGRVENMRTSVIRPEQERGHTNNIRFEYYPKQDQKAPQSPRQTHNRS